MTCTGAMVEPPPMRAAVSRAIGFLALWVILSGSASADLLPGILAALAATGISLMLLPSGRNRLQPLALASFATHLLLQSIAAGIDVARRALDPRLPISPGLVRYAVGLSPGSARNTFTTLMSLLPGTVPIRPDVSGRLIVHCLDAGQPVAVQLAAEEALLVRAIGRRPGDG